MKRRTTNVRMIAVRPRVEAIQDVKSAVDTVVPIDQKTHSKGIQLARDHVFNFYDALIIASALEAGCSQLLSEDLQAGRRVNGLTIVNPFLGLKHLSR